MEKKDRISKITKVILNDLKGPRVVHHNFPENKIEKKRRINKEIKLRKDKNKNWEFILWTFASVLFVGMFVSGLFMFGGEKKQLNNVVIKNKNTYKSNQYKPSPKKHYPITKTEYRKKSNPT